MSDKFRSVAPLSITLAESEMPTGNKLTAIVSQQKAGFSLLEKAIGDIFNQSGDSLLYNYPLQIANIARIIGEQKYMNPAIFKVINEFDYVDNVGNAHQNLNEGYLQFKPKDGTSMTATGGNTILVTEQTNEYDVLSSGDYWVDYNTGKIKSFDEMDSA